MQYRDEFIKVLELYISIGDEHLERVSTVKYGVYFKSRNIWSMH